MKIYHKNLDFRSMFAEPKSHLMLKTGKVRISLSCKSAIPKLFDAGPNSRSYQRPLLD